MSKDRLERKAYRKSPGRQYGYEYDPLRTQSGRSQSGSASRSGTLATQRPNPRRTRQLLRQNILAGKRYNETGEEEVDEIEQAAPYSDAPVNNTPYERRRLVHRNPIVRPNVAATDDLEHANPENEQDWQALDDELEYVEPEPDYAAPLDDYPDQPGRFTRRPPGGLNTRARKGIAPSPEDEYEEDYDQGYDEEAYEEVVPERRSPARPKARKRKMNRRGLLIGAGAAVVSGAAIAAYELGPRIPQAMGEVGSNIEHQLQDAFNKGVTQGADEARREIISSLDNLEGVTLNGAMAAARLTRVAYDVFVSPIVHFGSSLTGDFLNGMLRAIKTARGWLQGAYQDNSSLEAIQKVLESWVGQVTSMPKQLDAITDTDLDGAQAYLRALQSKLNEEKAKLNKPSPTAGTKPTPAASPVQKGQ